MGRALWFVHLSVSLFINVRITDVCNEEQTRNKTMRSNRRLGTSVLYGPESKKIILNIFTLSPRTREFSLSYIGLSFYL